MLAPAVSYPDLDMLAAANITHPHSNLKATAILDFKDRDLSALAESLHEHSQSNRAFVQKAHRRLCELLRPVYSVDEQQPASQTLHDRKGSCSQRMACLEAICRATGISTRVRALHVKGSFWYPRFRLARPFIPRKIMLVWPQFLLEGTWVGFEEIYSPLERLVEASPGFTNTGESLFEAVQKTPVDFLGKTCGLACAQGNHDLSRFVLRDEGLFDTRDEVFAKFGSFQDTLRGRAFEFFFGGTNSSR